MLARLEKLPGCGGAWIDHSGTYLRVRGPVDPAVELRKAGFRADPVPAPQVDRWYSSEETFLLSAEEAEAVSGRLVARARIAADLTEEECARLRSALKEELVDFYRGFGARGWKEPGDDGARHIDRAVDLAFPDGPDARREKIRAALRRM